MLAINPASITPEKIAELKAQFRQAKPYPHIMIENFLKEDVARDLFNHFPKMSELRKHYNGLNEQKSEGSAFDSYHEAFQKVQHDIQSQELINIIQEITGIEDISIPNDFRGSGVHQGRNGSFLDVHVDFSVHPTLNMHRRLNLLIYLNLNWKPEYGGAVELWDADVKTLVNSYLPMFNRCVIFECSEISYHGYDKINVPEDESRKSIYAYYYTPVGPNVRYHDTIFKARPSEGTMKHVKTNLKESLKNTIKGTMKSLGLKKVFDKIE